MINDLRSSEQIQPPFRYDFAIYLLSVLGGLPRSHYLIYYRENGVGRKKKNPPCFHIFKLSSVSNLFLYGLLVHDL